jgi:hypothetical protein
VKEVLAPPDSFVKAEGSNASPACVNGHPIITPFGH